MSALVRLYPRPWRDRYEAEVLDLLDQRGLSIADRVDLVRGAIDAHLHPQVSSSQAARQPWTHRIPGMVALTAGLLVTASMAVVIVRDGPVGESDGVAGTAVALMFISLPGDYMLAGYGRRIAVVLAVIAACFVGLQSIPLWPIQLAFAAVGYVILLGGMLGLAALRAGIGSRGRWRLVIAAVALPVLLGIPFALGLGPTEASSRLGFALAIPYGLAWLLIGSLMALRGAPTIVEPPSLAIEPEVHPA